MTKPKRTRRTRCAVCGGLGCKVGHFGLCPRARLQDLQRRVNDLNARLDAAKEPSQ